MPSKEETTNKLIAEYNELAARIQAHQLEGHILGSAGTAAEMLPALDHGRASKQPAATGPKPRVRWLPLRGRIGGSTRGGSYMRAAGCEDGAALCTPRYDIGGVSSEEGSDAGEPYAAGTSSGHGGHDEVDGGAISLTCIVPAGGEAAFRIIVPSGSQIVVPLPEGTRAGDEVAFELDHVQMAALPRSDLAALVDGRFHIEPGDGE